MAELAPAALRNTSRLQGCSVRPRKKYKRKTLYPRVSRLRRLANERERERSQLIQTAFRPLQEIVWKDSPDSKRQALPKIQVLRAAIGYIDLLARIMSGEASPDEEWAVRRRINECVTCRMDSTCTEDVAEGLCKQSPDSEGLASKQPTSFLIANILQPKQSGLNTPHAQLSCRRGSQTDSESSFSSSSSPSAEECDLLSADSGDLLDLSPTQADVKPETFSSELTFDFDAWLHSFDIDEWLGDELAESASVGNVQMDILNEFPLDST